MTDEKTKKTQAHTRYRLKATEEWPKGQIVAGITTIIGILAKPALITWANRLGLQGVDVNKFVDDKADIGTLAHTIIEDHLLGRQTDFSDYTPKQKDQAENSVLSFFEWQKNHKIEILFAERPLVSEVFRYGGTADIYGLVDGTDEMIELKTGSGIWPEHYIQAAANVNLLVENGFDVKRARILNIPRSEDETFAEAIVPNLDKNFELFKCCLRIYQLRKELKGDKE